MNENVDLSKIVESLNKYKLDIPKFDIPQFDIPKFNIPEYHQSIIEAVNIQPIRNPLIELTEEQNRQSEESNKHLKSLVDYTENILNYNRELVSLNEKILSKINSLDNTLLFLNEAFLDKVQVDNENEIEKKALLLELITIIDSQDKSKLNMFISALAGPVAAGVIVEYFKFKVGLT